jgi:hypothetical protein
VGESVEPLQHCLDIAIAEWFLCKLRVGSKALVIKDKATELSVVHPFYHKREDGQKFSYVFQSLLK